ncbi:MAG: RHS repeat-associated core domain-containing protein [Desulfobacterales bacterium]|jgi:RHS repeat-associated protein
MENLVCRHAQIPDAEVVWSQDYLPFGKELSTLSGGDNFRFTGQELEPALGIYDYGARYYDPLLRRFIQLDNFKGDIEDPRTLNRYSYTLNNPTGYIDPTGNFADKILPLPLIPPVIVGARPTGTDIDETDESDDKTKQYKDNKVRERLLGEHGLPTQIDGIDNFLGEEVTAYAKPDLFSTDFRLDIADRLMKNYSSLSRKSQNRLAREFYELLEISKARAQYHLSQGKTMAHEEVRQNWELGRRAQQGLNQATRPLDWQSASTEQKAAFLLQMGLFYLNSSAGYKAPGLGFNTGQKANGMPVTQKKGTFRGWGPGWK